MLYIECHFPDDGVGWRPSPTSGRENKVPGGHDRGRGSSCSECFLISAHYQTFLIIKRPGHKETRISVYQTRLFLYHRSLNAILTSATLYLLLCGRGTGVSSSKIINHVDKIFQLVIAIHVIWACAKSKNVSYWS